MKALFPSIVTLIVLGQAEAQYTPGFAWNRNSDWSGGTRAGGSWMFGNPDDDQRGNPSWSYEWVSGGAFGSPNPWYRQTPTLAVWDEHWYGGEPVWAQGDNSGPPMHRGVIVHDRGAGGLFERQPLVRWLNPTRQTIAVAIRGTLRVTWSGNSNLGCPTAVDVIIARVTQSGDYAELLAVTANKPIASCTVGDRVELPVSIENLGIGPRDQVLISVRAREFSAGQWIMLDDNVNIELIDTDACAADFNGDGFVDFFDYAEFVEAFEQGC